ncbi:MAG: hypothetical protein D6704_01865 [Nitrospirae bacterium]|nr:MAG: hypothetical protein D6704_01865 [Nitrospirota bacterium]
MMYTLHMNTSLAWHGSLIVVLALNMCACAARMNSLPVPFGRQEGRPVVMGFVDVQVHGPITRIVPPYITFLELLNRQTRERVFLTIQAPDSPFYIHLVPGDYLVTRVQVNEAGFRGMASLHHAFTVTDHPVQYLGHWHFALASPTTIRRLSLSIESNLTQAVADLLLRYPTLSSESVVPALPVPLTGETRLFEITPYPRVWWYVRNPPT